VFTHIVRQQAITDAGRFFEADPVIGSQGLAKIIGGGGFDADDLCQRKGLRNGQSLACHQAAATDRAKEMGQGSALIDARLDTIDRMLLGQVPRSDRHAILREVESQIEELLAERDTSTLTREDILEILAKLDPPEAYMPERIEGDSSKDQHRINAGKTKKEIPLAQNPTTSASQLPFIGAIIGIAGVVLSLTVSPLSLALALILDQGGIFFATTGFVSLVSLTGGIFGLAISIFTRGKGSWPFIGTLAASMSILLAVVMPVILFFVGSLIS